MKAEIVAIGTEILMGEITDTNSSYIAARLPALGIDLYWVHGVGDNVGRLVEVLRRAWDRSDLVLTTGGLGPTEDDVTREAIAQMLGEEMVVDPGLEDALRERFLRRGTDMPLRNLKQATLISSASVVPNPIGTAPGWWVEKDGHILVAMPGVRREMYGMWEEQVVPRLRQLSTGAVINSRIFKTSGVGEGAVDERLGPLLSSSNPTIGVYAKQDGVHVRLAAKAATREDADAMLDDRDPQVREALGPIIWGVNDDTLEGVVGGLLTDRGLTLAVMESCTGGLLSSIITDVPGSSAYFKGGLVAYTPEIKQALGVSPELITQHGVVSAQVAEAMAEAVRLRLGADVGLSTTGVAGPEQLEGHPPGTIYLAVSSPQGKASTSGGFYPLARLDIKQRAANNALHLLRRHILGLE